MDAINDYLKSLLPTLKKFTKIFSTTQDGFDDNIFREKCKSHTKTLVIVKSSNGKILGTYFPMKWYY